MGNADYYDNPDIANYFEAQENFEADKPFYLKLLGAAPKSVLEVGSGTGRVSRVLSESGHHVTGVEQSKPMIEAALEHLDKEEIDSDRRPDYIHGDVLEDPPPGDKFDFVLIPEYTFGNFLDPAEQKKVLEYAKNALSDSGTLCLHLYLPDPAYFASLRLGHVGNGIREEVGTLSIEGIDKTVVVTKTNNYSRVTGNVHSEVFYDAVDPAGYVSRTIQHIASHAFTPSEVRQLLETSGFKNIVMYGDFSFGPLTDSSFDMIITASPN